MNDLSFAEQAAIDRPRQLIDIAGQIANEAAARGAFDEFAKQKSASTRRAYLGDLKVFAEYLAAATNEVGKLVSHESEEKAPTADELISDASAWTGITHGLVEMFRGWMLDKGYSIKSINRRLGTVRVYAMLAAKGEHLDRNEALLIQSVKGYGHKAGINVDKERAKTATATRISRQKVSATHISEEQAKALKAQPDTPQGRRDRLMMCLLLDHGLRVGEVALLEVRHFNIKTGVLDFYRPKVALEQKHTLTADTILALTAWFESGDCPESGPILRGSRKGGHLTHSGMTEGGINKRVGQLGKAIDIDALSPHDCRHHWATYWADRVDTLKRGLLQLKEAGGWSSLAMPERYVERAAFANEGMA